MKARDFYLINTSENWPLGLAKLLRGLIWKWLTRICHRAGESSATWTRKSMKNITCCTLKFFHILAFIIRAWGTMFGAYFCIASHNTPQSYHHSKTQFNIKLDKYRIFLQVIFNCCWRVYLLGQWFSTYRSWRLQGLKRPFHKIV